MDLIGLIVISTYVVMMIPMYFALIILTDVEEGVVIIGTCFVPIGMIIIMVYGVSILRDKYQKDC